MLPIEVAFATPRKLPKARDLRGRVAVVDLAFASEASGGGFDKITRPFIDGLGPRLVAWVDHHDHAMHAHYASDPRFVLATKAMHGACPEMVTPALVARFGPIDTIVCHTDFDGLCTAAKWIRGGEEPYPGADDDARAIDTRTGQPSAVGARIDRALRARSRDVALCGVIMRHLVAGLADASLWGPIDAAGGQLASREDCARKIAAKYEVLELLGGANKIGDRLAFVDASRWHAEYDKTLLLLLGQERAPIAMLIDADNLTLAARFDSGINFLALLGLSGGMPTLVSVHKDRFGDAMKRLGVRPDDLMRLVG